MPIYLWIDKKTGKKVEVIRTFAEYEVPPHGDELPVELRDLSDHEIEWERSVGDKISVTKGWGWGGKGQW
jgi:hypothetical protein